jgi:hypothetical protein
VHISRATLNTPRHVGEEVRMSLRIAVLLLGVVALPVAAQQQAGAPRGPAVPKAANAVKIASAMSAAPVEISGKASVAEVGADGKLVMLREGTNGWLCLPDDPSTPKPDPICADKMWQQWFQAWMAKKPPAVTQVGIAYMLMGSSDASNTDPFATKPAAGADWVVVGPHTMVLLPDPKQLDSYPTDRKSGGPFVMFKGTPYAHLMVPSR